jgi:hypothetical protein
LQRPGSSRTGTKGLQPSPQGSAAEEPSYDIVVVKLQKDFTEVEEDCLTSFLPDTSWCIFYSLPVQDVTPSLTKSFDNTQRYIVLLPAVSRPAPTFHTHEGGS